MSDVLVLDTSDGGLDLGALEAAIIAAVEAVPALSGDGPIDIRHHEVLDAMPARIDAHLLGLVANEALPKTGRPIRFHITETPSLTYFQTVHAHGVVDAAAQQALLTAIAAAFVGPRSGVVSRECRSEVRHETRPSVSPSNVGSITEALSSRVRGLAARAKRTLAERIDRLEVLGATFGGLAVESKSARRRTAVGRFALGTRETAAIVRAARTRGVPVEALLHVAFLRAATSFDGRRGSFRTTFRVWNESAGSAASDGSVHNDAPYAVELDARWSDDEALARTASTIARRGGKDSARRTNVTFASASMFELESFGDARVVDHVVLTDLDAASDVSFSLSTFRGRLRILATYDREAFGATLHGDLFEPLVRHLGALAEVDLACATTHDAFVATWSSARALAGAFSGKLSVSAIPFRRSA